MTVPPVLAGQIIPASLSVSVEILSPVVVGFAYERRIAVVPAENRTFVVDTDQRTLIVERE